MHINLDKPLWCAYQPRYVVHINLDKPSCHAKSIYPPPDLDNPSCYAKVLTWYIKHLIFDRKCYAEEHTSGTLPMTNVNVMQKGIHQAPYLWQTRMSCKRAYIRHYGKRECHAKGHTSGTLQMPCKRAYIKHLT